MKLRVNGFAISLDGYGAGPDQSIDNPLGVGGTALHEWAQASVHAAVALRMLCTADKLAS